MDLSVVERWQHTAQVELFYNSSERRLAFKKYNFIYAKNVDSLQSNPYIDLHDFRFALHSAQFRTACFAPSENLLAFQRNEEDLVRAI
jgi:hypothetical protein